MRPVIDQYCERTTPDIFAEPLNILSNIGFIFVTVILFKIFLRFKFQSSAKKELDIFLLITLIFLVGLGSSLWHLLAVSWALSADVIPILLFINLFILSCLFRVFHCSWKIVVIWFALYHVFNTTVRFMIPADFLNGSIFYLPTMFFLWGIVFVSWQRKLPERHFYIKAATLFLLALCFRSLDNTICDAVPMGTHFVWHFLVAAVMFYAVKGLFYNFDKKPTGA